MSDKLVTLSKRIHQDQNGTMVLIAHEGQQVKESLITSLGYKLEDVTAVETKVRTADVENKAVKPAASKTAPVDKAPKTEE